MVIPRNQTARMVTGGSAVSMETMMKQLQEQIIALNERVEDERDRVRVLKKKERETRAAKEVLEEELMEKKKKNRELKKVKFGTLIGVKSRRAKREARKRKKQNRNALVKAAKAAGLTVPPVVGTSSAAKS